MSGHQEYRLDLLSQLPYVEIDSHFEKIFFFLTRHSYSEAGTFSKMYMVREFE